MDDFEILSRAGLPWRLYHELETRLRDRRTQTCGKPSCLLKVNDESVCDANQTHSLSRADGSAPGERRPPEPPVYCISTYSRWRCPSRGARRGDRMPHTYMCEALTHTCVTPVRPQSRSATAPQGEVGASPGKESSPERVTRIVSSRVNHSYIVCNRNSNGTKTRKAKETRLGLGQELGSNAKSKPKNACFERKIREIPNSDTPCAAHKKIIQHVLERSYRFLGIPSYTATIRYAIKNISKKIAYLGPKHTSEPQRKTNHTAYERTAYERHPFGQSSTHKEPRRERPSTLPAANACSKRVQERGGAGCARRCSCRVQARRPLRTCNLACFCRMLMLSSRAQIKHPRTEHTGIGKAQAYRCSVKPHPRTPRSPQ